MVGLAAPHAAAAATIGSPLHFPQRQDAAVRHAMKAGETLLDLDARAFAELRRSGRGESVRLEAFPFAPSATGDLLLERFEVTTPDAQILVQTERGTEVLPMPLVAHFRGRLEGDVDSRVYVGAHAGFLIAIVKTSAGVVYVGPEGPLAGPVQHVLRTADSPLNAELTPTGWRCDADDLPPAPTGNAAPAGEPAIRPSGAQSVQAALALREAAISIETDQELLAKHAGNVTAMSAYITSLFGVISVIYERDVQVHLTVNRIQAWTTTDPYSATSARTQLDEIGDWWHGNRPKASYPRTAVHFLSGKTGSGGIAWLDVLCVGDFSQGGHWGGAYGVTQVNGTLPASPWDVLGVAHELGHNFGSPHTHCHSPPIDQCHGGEGGCYSGPTVHPGPLGGTIMSYCHLLPGGYGNVDLRFHERSISEEMLPLIAGASCLGAISNPTPPTATKFYTVQPCRVADTRNPTGPYGGPALAANSDRTFAVGGRCGVPTTARAVSVNLTVAAPSAPGNLLLYAGGTAQTTATAINYRAGQTRANNGFASLGNAGTLAVRCNQTSGSVQVIIDVNGYFQ